MNYELLLALTATASGAQAQEATPDRPNVVFILADDMGYGDLSCFGSKYVKTPNIDRLSQTGTTFTQCYAGSGISSPSCSMSIASRAVFMSTIPVDRNGSST